MRDKATEELASRSGDGLSVSLLWRRSDNRLTVLVEDVKGGAAFCIPAPPDRALEVFYHPFAYAA
jgi:hypothetical protein